ncbi:MAG TPA: hypothetical protein VGF94_30625 [Kofleriaceae bacterium]|jgi:hypothetical protein
MRLSLAAALLLTACAADPASPPAPPAPTSPPPREPLPPAQCMPAAGKLTLYAIPPPIALDWSNPNTLLSSVVASKLAAGDVVDSGAAAITHSIGHVNVELDCGDLSVPLTGQTDTGGGEWRAATDGAGLLLRDTQGVLDAMPEADGGDPAATAADLAAREASGNVALISFVVNRPTCARIKAFVDAYVAAGAYTNYDGAFRARRLEGAGCAIFGAGVVDVAGLLRRSLFTPVWARSEMIGSARIGELLGSGGYRYGGNLVARDDAGDWLWPNGQDVPVSATHVVLAGTSVLDTWSGPEDAPFAVPGLTGEMTTRLPFTIYDPQLMAAWAEQVWLDATDHATATAFGVPWTASSVAAAHEVTYDASCVPPQTIAFAADNDDLFEDSDATHP